VLNFEKKNQQKDKKPDDEEIKGDETNDMFAEGDEKRIKLSMKSGESVSIKSLVF